MTTIDALPPPPDTARVMVLRRPTLVALGVVSAVGAVLSWWSLYRYAEPTFGPYLAGGFPLLVDAMIAAASLAYLDGARRGRARPGWRLLAHASIGATVALNALAAHGWAGVPLHVTAPLA